MTNIIRPHFGSHDRKINPPPRLAQTEHNPIYTHGNATGHLVPLTEDVRVRQGMSSKWLSVRPTGT
ncbi:hypothetical protein HNR51_002282 [Methylorubrum thiocyanatum]|uniref:Uncharacterized protein n=1 Tax=Methylorubrum thiocyanatum TaxID=47958 RepID=A0AA40VAG8_9HYPH|nr:hypothetical protein [Methylorubrum thiocyanatum]GJE80320.1 hypothetical protein CJNNKLLH_1653 [Methylorubrum thiocyanatum]